MALVKLRHFIVESDFDWGGDDFTTDFRFESESDLNVDLAALLEANTMAEREVDRELRYQVLQHEQRMVLSYLQDAGHSGPLQLDQRNFTATAGHIKRFVCESVGLGMLTAAVQEYFAWTLGPDAIANFDVLPGELKESFAKKGARPDLLFDFKDGVRTLAGEARGRSRVGPPGTDTRLEQHRRMREILRWSRDHDAYPVTMTWAYLGGKHVQVDLFTMSTDSIGNFEYMPPTETIAVNASGAREQLTDDAIRRSERRALSLFDSAPPAPVREPRTLFGREVKGSWVTADLVHPSRVRLFIGATEQPVDAADVRAARSRGRRRTPRPADGLETAVSDRLVLVVARSDDPEPEWRRVEAVIERGEDG